MSTVLSASPSISQASGVEAELNYLAPGDARPVNYTFEPPAGTPWSSGTPDRKPAKSRSTGMAFNWFRTRAGVRCESSRGAETGKVVPAMLWIRQKRIRLAGFVAVDEVRRHEVVGRDRACIAKRERKLLDYAERPPQIDDGKSMLESALGFIGIEVVAYAARSGDEGLIVVHAPNGLTKGRVGAGTARAVTQRMVENDDFLGPRDVAQQRLGLGAVDEADQTVVTEVIQGAAVRPDELLLLKIYDSLEDGTARLTAHTAFEDPNSPSNAAARRSIELRALLFWAPDHDTH